QQRVRRQRQFHRRHELLPRQRQRHRVRAAILSMAVVRHRARLQHVEPGNHKQVAVGDRGIPERAVLGAVVSLLRNIAMTIMTPYRTCRQRLVDLWCDRSGIAATEFAVIVPLMLVLFFGVVEFSTAVAIDRKVTLTARTLSDLVSQGTSASDADFTG